MEYGIAAFIVGGAIILYGIAQYEYKVNDLETKMLFMWWSYSFLNF